MQSKSIMYLATYKVNQQINDHHQKTEKNQKQSTRNLKTKQKRMKPAQS